MNKKRLILGLLLITLGIVVMAFFGMNTLNATPQPKATESVTQLETKWAEPTPSATPTPKAVDPALDDLTNVANGEAFATIRIPALGPEWKKTIMQGTGPDVLDTLEVGHYKSTENPGQLGNFALAGHNNTQNTVFDLVPNLKVGDEIIIETKHAVYTYTFRSSEIVTPDKNNVLLPVPWQNGVKPTEAILTLTTCWPVDSWDERWISYSVLKSAVAK